MFALSMPYIVDFFHDLFHSTLYLVGSVFAVFLCVLFGYLVVQGITNLLVASRKLEEERKKQQQWDELPLTDKEKQMNEWAKQKWEEQKKRVQQIAEREL